MRARYLLANAYIHHNEPANAIGVLRQIAEATPKDPQPYLVTGMVLLQQNDRTDARKEFELALELAPDFPPALEQLVNLATGRAAARGSRTADRRPPREESRLRGSARPVGQGLSSPKGFSSGGNRAAQGDRVEGRFTRSLLPSGRGALHLEGGRKGLGKPSEGCGEEPEGYPSAHADGNDPRPGERLSRSEGRLRKSAR